MFVIISYYFIGSHWFPVTEMLTVFCMVTELEWFIAILRHQHVSVHGNSQVVNKFYICMYVCAKKNKQPKNMCMYKMASFLAVLCM